MSYQLQVHHAGQTLVYNASVVEDGEYSISEGVSGQQVEMQDVQLLLHGASFLGASSVYALPTGDGETEGSWRARLLYSGSVILDGVILLDGGITHTPDTQTWMINLLSYALEDALRRASQVNISEASFMLASNWIQTLRRSENLTGFYENWFTLQSVFNRVAIVAGFAMNAPPVDDYTLVYNDGGTERTYTPTDSRICISAMAGAYSHDGVKYTYEDSLPDWNGRQLIEAVQALKGWRISAAYDGFPLRSITMTAIKDREVIPANPPVLDDYVERDGLPEHAREAAEYPDFALVMDEAGRTGLIAFPSGTYYDNVPDGIEVCGPQPPFAFGGAKGKLRMIEGKVENETVVQLPFVTPHVRYNDTPTSVVAPDSVGNPNLRESQWHADAFIGRRTADVDGIVSNDKCFIAAFDTSNTFGYARMIIERRFHLASTPGDVFLDHELWGYNLVEAYDASTRPLYVVRLKVSADAVAGVKVGDYAYGVELGGRTYMVRSMERIPNTNSVILEIVKPV